jgi:hypothetical protein
MSGGRIKRKLAGYSTGFLFPTIGWGYYAIT